MTIDPRMVKARSWLILNQPFWGSLSLHLELVEDHKMPTGATDGTKLWYSPKFLDTIDVDVTRFFVAHEVDHCAKKHTFRRKGRDAELWNIATDHQINLDLKKAGFKVPTWALCDPQYDGLSADEIYSILLKQRQAQQQQSGGGQGDGDDASDQGGSKPSDDDADDGKPNGGQALPKDDGVDSSGSDSGDQGDGGTADKPETEGQGTEGGDHQTSPDPGRCGGVIDAADTPAEMAEQEAEWDVNVRQAVNVAVKAAGCVPGGLGNIVKELRTPKQDWRAVLRQFIDPSSRKDYSWSRPNRRFPGAGYVLPGTVTDGVNHVGIAVDCSGSIDLGALARFQGEIQSALDDGAVDNFTVAYFDADVYASDTFTNGDTITFRPARGGGTAFVPPLRWFSDNASDVSAVLFFTDMFAGDWRAVTEPPYPVLWCAWGDPRNIRGQAKNVTFGDVIELDD